MSEGKPLPDGIVVDVTAVHLYWTNIAIPTANDGSIERSDLDGSSVTHIVPPGDTFTPKQLQLDEKNQKLYWCDRQGTFVMRANLDGSKIELSSIRAEATHVLGKDNKEMVRGESRWLDVEGGSALLDSEGSGQCRRRTNVSRQPLAP